MRSIVSVALRYQVCVFSYLMFVPVHISHKNNNSSKFILSRLSMISISHSAVIVCVCVVFISCPSKKKLNTYSQL